MKRFFLITMIFLSLDFLSLADILPNMKVVDLNNDGYSDLFYLSGDGTVTVFENDKTGQFKADGNFSINADSSGRMEVVDTHGDNIPDLLIPYPNEGGMEVISGPKYISTQRAITGLGIDAALVKAGKVSTTFAALGFLGIPKVQFIDLSKESLSQGLSEGVSLDANLADLDWGDWDNNGTDELVTLTQGRKPAFKIWKRSTTLFKQPWQSLLSIDITVIPVTNLAMGRLDDDLQNDIAAWSDGLKAIVFTGGSKVISTVFDLEESSRKICEDLSGDGKRDFISISTSKKTINLFMNQGSSRFRKISVPDTFAGNGIQGGIVDVAIGFFSQTKQKEILVLYNDGLLRSSSNALKLFTVKETGEITAGKEISLPVPHAQDESKQFENVLVYKKTEYNQGNPYVYRSFHVDDWTTGSTLIANGVQIQHEVLTNGILKSEAAVSLTDLGLSGVLADYYFQINQTRPEKSFYSFGSPMLNRNIRLEITPASGTYHRTIIVEPTAETGADIYYKINNGQWQIYSAANPVILLKSSSLSFYAVKGSSYSSTETMLYTIDQPVSADADGDGIPDALETGFGLPIFSTARDYDGDGWDDLDELIRFSDPKSKISVPNDADKLPSGKSSPDGWSDFDELFRFTDAGNPKAQPSATGLYVGEYQIKNLQAGSALKSTEDGHPVSEGSVLDVMTLSSAFIDSATSVHAKWNFRLSGDQPYILRLKEKNSQNMVLLGYSAPYEPCWSPAARYDGAKTGEQWLGILRDDYKNMYSERSGIVLDASSTAATIGFEYWLAKEIASLPGIAGVSDPNAIKTISESYNFDDVYAYFAEITSRQQPLLDLVNQSIEWGKVNAPSISLDTIILAGLNGKLLNNIQTSISLNIFVNARKSLDEMLLKVPSKEISVTGELSLSDSTPVLTTLHNITYQLDLGNAGFVEGSTVTVEGILSIPTCGNGSMQVITVHSIVSSAVALNLNNTDSDNDGLPNQWEQFYFGRADAKPSDDPDNDSYPNEIEYQNYSNPLDKRSVPSAVNTPTPTPTTPVTRPTYTPTPIPVMIPDWYIHN